MSNKKYRKILDKKLNKIWKYLNKRIINSYGYIMEKDMELWEVHFEFNNKTTTILISSHCIVIMELRKLKRLIMKELNKGVKSK